MNSQRIKKDLFQDKPVNDDFAQDAPSSEQPVSSNPGNSRKKDQRADSSMMWAGVVFLILVVLSLFFS